MLKISKILYLLVLMLALTPIYGAVPFIPAVPQIAAKSYVLLEADTGYVIAEHNNKQRLSPASLTKIMTGYVVASEIDGERLRFDDEVDISVKAWRTEGSRMFVQEGTKVLVEELLRGMVIQSGNDASVALAEHIASSEASFADIMNQYAQQLGMVDTNFLNATGLPDTNHYTTASDLAKLTSALIKNYPDHYTLYKERFFTYNGIRQPNRNKLLWHDPSVDGVKTGRTEAAGYCLVVSAQRDGMRLISVIMGASSSDMRMIETQKLLTHGFRYYETIALYKAYETLKTVRIWGGNIGRADLGLSQGVNITIPRGSREQLTVAMEIQQVIKAPLSKGQEIGTIIIKHDEGKIGSFPIVALFDVTEAGFLKGIWDAIKLFFTQLLDNDTLAIE